MKKYLAEALGTFILIFCGTGSIVINQETGGALIGHLGIAISFGLVVTAVIYTFGAVSGAHINPAVTVCFSLAGLFPKKEILPYVTSQVVGACLASLLLKLLFPANEYLGGTRPSGTEMQSFILELVLSFMLMLVILFTSQGSKEVGVLAGLAIGATVLLEALFAGPVCGASMNPVRSLSPALVSGHLSALWIYLTAPLLGMALATGTWRVLKS